MALPWYSWIFIFVEKSACVRLQEPDLHYISIMSLLPYLARVVDREDLPAKDADSAMQIILSGAATHPQIAAFLVALKMKGETAGELVGFARAMRRMATPVDAGLNGQTLLDTCGTGGDGCATFNISTTAGVVVAGGGVHAPKPGDRSTLGQWRPGG